MNGVERVDSGVRCATASTATGQHRGLTALVRAAAIVLVVGITGFAGVASAHAEGTDGSTSDSTETYDIGTPPMLAADTTETTATTEVYDIGTAPLLDDLPIQADLGLAVVASTPSPYVDHSFSWTVRVGNSGSASALAVVVTDLVPNQVTVIGVSSNDFTCTAVGNAVTCLRDELAPGASGQITIDVMVPNSDTPQVLSNGVSVTSATPDAAPANNSATSSVETVVVEVGPPAVPDDSVPASPVPVTTLAEVAPTGPAPTTTTAAVAVAAPDFTDTLPLTGSSVQPLWLVAGEALLIGLGLLAIARRRTAAA